MKNIFKIMIGAGIVTVSGLLIKKFVNEHTYEIEEETPDEEETIETEESLPEHLKNSHEKIMNDLEELIDDDDRNNAFRDELEKIRQENLADFERMAKTYGVKAYMDISHDIYERTKLFKEKLQKEDTPNE